MKKPKLFVDMDGVLAEWKPIDVPLQTPSEKIKQYINDTLYQKGYFRDLKPNKNALEAVKQIIKEGKIDVYVLSCVLPENEKYPGTPLKDKNDWLDEYFGDLIPQAKRIFVPDGEPKPMHIPFKLEGYDTLLDDYTMNLHTWISMGTNAIKFVNPINDTHKSFIGARVYESQSPEEIKDAITQNIYAKRDKVKSKSSDHVVDEVMEFIKSKYAIDMSPEDLNELRLKIRLSHKENPNLLTMKDIIWETDDKSDLPTEIPIPKKLEGKDLDTVVEWAEEEYGCAITGYSIDGIVEREDIER